MGLVGWRGLRRADREQLRAERNETAVGTGRRKPARLSEVLDEGAVLHLPHEHRAVVVAGGEEHALAVEWVGVRRGGPRAIAVREGKRARVGGRPLTLGSKARHFTGRRSFFLSEALIGNPSALMSMSLEHGKLSGSNDEQLWAPVIPAGHSGAGE